MTTYRRMAQFIRSIYDKLFMRVGKKKAIAIVRGYVAPGIHIYEATDNLNRVNLYKTPQERCWCVYVSWDDKDIICLRSSQVVLVSKQSGRILYDGTASDEG